MNSTPAHHRSSAAVRRHFWRVWFAAAMTAGTLLSGLLLVVNQEADSWMGIGVMLLLFSAVFAAVTVDATRWALYWLAVDMES